MFLRTKLTVIGLALGVISFGAIALAQQPQINNPATGVQQGRRAGLARRAMQRRARFGMFRALRQLDLTDEQKQQARSIIQSQLQSTKAQRQELRQLTRQWREGTITTEGVARARELRTQLAESRQAVRLQLAGILTTEQKTKLQEVIKARRTNPRSFGRPNQTPG